MRREVLASLSPAYSTNGWGHTVTNFGVPDAERGSTADAMNARLLVLAFGLLASTRAETPALVLQRPEAKSDGSTPEWGARAS